MAIIRVQKGTKDILPPEMPVWHFMEEKAAEVFAKYGAKETAHQYLKLQNFSQEELATQLTS